MSIIEHAKKEFFHAGWCDKDGNFECDMQKEICENVLDLLRVLSSQGHSGTTAPYCINLFKQLSMFKTITEISGDDSEWNECGEGVFQNNRLSSVFKGDDGLAYDIDGRVYWEWYESDDGCVERSYFSKGGDRFYIEFPYTQKEPERVFSPTENYPNEILNS